MAHDYSDDGSENETTVKVGESVSKNSHLNEEWWKWTENQIAAAFLLHLQ